MQNKVTGALELLRHGRNFLFIRDNLHKWYLEIRKPRFDVLLDWGRIQSVELSAGGNLKLERGHGIDVVVRTVLLVYTAVEFKFLKLCV